MSRESETTTAPAATALQPSPPRGNAKRLYPRSRGVRFLRDVLRRWWIIVGFIAASAIQTIGQILLQSGVAGLNPDGLKSTAIGQLAAAHGPMFWPIAVVLVLLIPIGWTAHVDHQREQKALAEQHEVELREQTVEAVVREQTVEAVVRDQVAQSIALMSAPPLDVLNTPPHFVDRVEALRWLIENLRDAPAGATLSIEGLGGLGKTSLAAEALQQARRLNLFPGGTAVVLCENRSDSMAILRAVLKRFSRSSALDAAEDADLAGLAQRLLAGKRALVVLDNVEPELRLGDIVGPLQAAGATILLTARFRVPAEIKTGALRLDVLDEADAVEVFKEYYGRAVSDETLAAVRRIVAATGRLTLAIVLAAQNAADNERAIPALAEELAGAEAVLDLTEDAQMLSHRETRGVRIVFEQSYRALSEPAQRLFQALAVMPTGEFGREAALAVGRGVGVERVDSALDLLVRRALLEQFVGAGGAERLRQHPLLRAFAADQADTASRAVAGRAMAEYYAWYLAEHSADFRTLDREYPNILGGLRWIHDRAGTQEAGWAASLTARYFTTLRRYLFLAGHNRDAAELLAWGIEAARAVGDRELEAALVTDSGIPFRDQRDYEPAIERYEAGLALARAAGSRPVEAFALGRLADLAHSRRQWDESIQLREQACAIYQEIGDETNWAHTKTDIGHVLSDEGEYARARLVLDEALPVAQRVGVTRTIAYANLMLGKLIRRQGKPQEALPYVLRALEMYSQVGEVGSVGGALEDLGWIEEAQGQREQALMHWRQAAEIYDAMGISRADYVRDNLIGKPLGQRDDL